MNIGDERIAAASQRRGFSQPPCSLESRNHDGGRWLTKAAPMNTAVISAVFSAIWPHHFHTSLEITLARRWLPSCPTQRV